MYEPYRLIDPSITDSDRLEAKTGFLESRLKNPNMLLRVAKHQEKVVGWICWTKPEKEHVPYQPVPQSYRSDIETDTGLRDQIHAEKDKMRRHFIGDRPSWSVIITCSTRSNNSS